MNDEIYDLNWRPLIPMGAVREDDKIEEYLADPNYIGQRKMDGFRMLCWLGENCNRFTTRSVGVESYRAGNPWPTERTDCMPHLRDMKHSRKSGTILDGEIWKPGCKSHDMSSMIGGSPETSIANQAREGKVHYQIYDIIQFHGKDVTDLPLWERQKLIMRVYGNLVAHNEDLVEYLSVAENLEGEDIQIVYEEEVKAGREGIVLKHINSKYYLGEIKDGEGKPAKHKANKKKGIPHTPWCKWKKYKEYDVVIMGFNPATIAYTGKDLANWKYWQNDISGAKATYVNQRAAQIHINGPITAITKWHYEGWIGAIVFGQYVNGELKQIGDTSGIDDQMRAEFTVNQKEYIGRVAIIGAFEQIKKTNALREPRFKSVRPIWDKAPSECIPEGS